MICCPSGAITNFRPNLKSYPKIKKEEEQNENPYDKFISFFGARGALSTWSGASSEILRYISICIFSSFGIIHHKTWTVYTIAFVSAPRLKIVLTLNYPFSPSIGSWCPA